MSRKHRTSRRTAKYVVPSVMLTAGLVLGHAVLSSTPATAPAPGAVNLELANASMAALPAVRDLGPVTGTLVLPAPAGATEGRLVAVVRSGAKRVLRKVATAPAAVRIDTRALPSGTYTVTLRWTHAGRTSVVATDTFQVQRSWPKHRPRPRPRPTGTATPPPPTPTAAPTTVPPTTVPPTTVPPTSGAPTTAPPTATVSPTVAPTTGAPTAAPTTAPPTTPPATAPPTTKPPTTKPPTSTVAPTTVAPTTTAPAPAPGFAQQILDLTNTARKNNGCNTPLKLNTQLNTAAQRHSDDMVAHNFFSHTGSDGSDPFQRMTAAGYRWGGAAENIAAGNTSASATMQQWMNSAGHKANILNCGLVDLGVGYTVGTGADYAGYWVQDFGSPL